MLGKGDAMWRALTVLTGDLVCFVDADSEDFGAHFATGLLGPLYPRASPAVRQGLLPAALQDGDAATSSRPAEAA